MVKESGTQRREAEMHKADKLRGSRAPEGLKDMCEDNKVDLLRKGWEGEEENHLVHNEYIN